jgi:hypothetical protein
VTPILQTPLLEEFKSRSSQLLLDPFGLSKGHV